MEKNRIFSKYKLDITDQKSNLLTRSLLWMSLGLAVIILVAWISSENLSFLDLAIRISSGSMWLVAWLINIIICIALFFTISNHKINILIPTFLYLAFAFYEGFFITTILVFSGSVNLVKDLLLYMLIPAAIFAIMGLIGYFNLINFTKLIPFTIFATFGLLILALVMMLTNSFIIEMIYLLISAAVFIIWVGFDLQMISRSSEAFSYGNKKTMNRLAFLFGVRLFIDFINLLWLFIRLFSRN